jgi:hypothetical protein
LKKKGEAKMDQMEAGANSVLHPKTVLISSIKTLPDYRNPRVLHEKYAVEKLSLKQIARQTSSSKAAVLDHLRRSGIPTRPPLNFNPSNPPYGKCYRHGKLVDLKKEMRVIRSIVVPLYLKGKNLVFIREFLNSKGIPPKSGKGKWHHEKVRLILQREGVYKIQRKLRGSGNAAPNLHKSKQRNVKGRTL